MINPGDRVKHADWSASSVPAYRTMAGTVVALNVRTLLAQVAWDCDGGIKPGALEGWYPTSELVPADD